MIINNIISDIIIILFRVLKFCNCFHTKRATLIPTIECAHLGMFNRYFRRKISNFHGWTLCRFAKV